MILTDITAMLMGARIMFMQSLYIVIAKNEIHRH